MGNSSIQKMYLAIGASSEVTSPVTVGIDSIYLQFKGINQKDSNRFCFSHGLSWKLQKKSDYARIWMIFLEGGQPITAMYHFKSKTTTFQVGRLMDYSTSDGNQHDIVRKLVEYFSDRLLQISGIDVAVDAKMKWQNFCQELREEIKIYDSSIYYNGNYKTVFLIYSKSTQLGIYSTSLTRFELRLRYKLGQWKLRDFSLNKSSLQKLVMKIEEGFRLAVKKYCEDTRKQIFLKFSVQKVLEDFIAFLHGDKYKVIKDHHKIKQALKSRDRFFRWMQKHRLADPKRINTYVKGKRAAMQAEIGIDAKTFAKAIAFYKAIPNFKVSKNTREAYVHVSVERSCQSMNWFTK